jgi:hypothetical protein
MGLYMNKFTRFFLACLCLGIAAMGTSPAFAAKKKAKSSKSVKVKHDNGSAEGTKDRERRLLRECRGQVNAGACAGLTRG